MGGGGFNYQQFYRCSPCLTIRFITPDEQTIYSKLANPETCRAWGRSGANFSIVRCDLGDFYESSHPRWLSGGPATILWTCRVLQHATSLANWFGITPNGCRKFWASSHQAGSICDNNKCATSYLPGLKRLLIPVIRWRLVFQLITSASSPCLKQRHWFLQLASAWQSPLLLW